MADLPPPCPVKCQISERRLDGEGNVAVYLALLNFNGFNTFNH